MTLILMYIFLVLWVASNILLSDSVLTLEGKSSELSQAEIQWAQTRFLIAAMLAIISGIAGPVCHALTFSSSRLQGIGIATGLGFVSIVISILVIVITYAIAQTTKKVETA
ncbi:MAG: hypothetical protein M1324_04350 [Patescibacteria group bacterium]|nr:hypothetical protein [Patescibacteria group bacterium]